MMDITDPDRQFFVHLRYKLRWQCGTKPHIVMTTIWEKYDHKKIRNTWLKSKPRIPCGWKLCWQTLLGSGGRAIACQRLGAGRLAVSVIDLGAGRRRCQVWLKHVSLASSSAFQFNFDAVKSG